MKQYLNLIETIMSSGVDRGDRTGTGTRTIFGHQMRFDLEEGFPLVTTKRTFWQGAFDEMLWMLRGDTNVTWLQERGVHIWDKWADEEGNLGPIYGAQWRSWRGERGKASIETDQLQELIDGLRDRPNSRRHIMSAWNPTDLPDESISPQDNVSQRRMALAPCHCLVQFFVHDNRLSCQMYQRSADVFLGVPFNIAGYALLTHILARYLGMKVGEFVWTGGDCHLYSNHFDQAQELLTRKPKPLPELVFYWGAEMAPWGIDPEDIAVAAYYPHPAIKAPVAV